MAPLALAFAALSLLSPVLPARAASASTSLPLRQLGAANTTVERYLLLSSLATASLLRAHQLRRPSVPSPILDASLSTQLPLSSHSFGGYTIPLSFGTPPQPLPLLLDTASHLVWLPCTPSYACSHCPSSSSSGPVFFPKSSSSSKLVGCKSPKCLWIHSPPAVSACRNCSTEDPDCPQICPPYFLLYASGSTGGILLSDRLQVPGLADVPNFAVGCSVSSTRQPPAGVAGFGRGPASFPSQLCLRRFSYCLIPRRFDDVPGKAGAVVLDGLVPSLREMNTTHFVRNPTSSPFDVYYYVALRKIVVGGRKVRMPRRLMAPGADGNGGTIVDSGSTFTFMEKDVFDAVSAALVGRYNRSAAAEEKTGLGHCFRWGDEELRLPAVELHFKGGAVMEPPARNWFSVLEETGDVCFMVVSGEEGAAAVGPAMILGGFQQQDYRMVFDLQSQRLGFRQESCLEA